MLDSKPVQATPQVLGQPGLHKTTWQVGKGKQGVRVEIRVCAEMAKTKSKLTNKIPQGDM